MAGPHVEKIQEAFLKDLQERGILHVLEWIDGYYDLVAEATIKDKLAMIPKEEHAAFLIKLASDNARYANNLSTSQGHNSLKLAEAVASARAAHPYIESLTRALSEKPSDAEKAPTRKAKI